MHIANVNNNFRVGWVTKSIKLLRSTALRSNPTLFDIGAGMQPYRQIAQDAGFTYKSHDFTQYDPDNHENKAVGIHTIGWSYPKQDLICDILEIPTVEKFDLVICTEVLEHVPDPVSSLRKLVDLVTQGGNLLITVPFGSMTHQAPYFFSSGYSPQFFEYWSEKLGLEIIELDTYGDLVDATTYQLKLLLDNILNFKFGRNLNRCIVKNFPRFRSRVPRHLNESFGFGVVFIGRKI